LTGKIHYELVKERQTRGLDTVVSFIRVEELCPFPFAELKQRLSRYTKAKEFIWLQEEPRNQGAYTHVWSRIDSVMASLGHGEFRVVYKGRKEESVPVTGIGSVYAKQQKMVVNAAFDRL
jgi:probable 2-oxoglutarate dehydrogenase E1 component DHKTD1